MLYIAKGATFAAPAPNTRAAVGSSDLSPLFALVLFVWAAGQTMLAKLKQKEGGIKGMMMKAALQESGRQEHPFPGPESKNALKKGGGVFTTLASDVGTKLKQAKAAGIDTASVGSVENLYRITKFLEKAGDNVGGSKQHTSAG